MVEENRKIDENLLRNYTDIKIRLKELQEQEKELKKQLLHELTSINKDEYETDFIKIFKKIQKRIFYPKDKLESQVPEELLSKIREEKEIIYLLSKIKKTPFKNEFKS